MDTPEMTSASFWQSDPCRVMANPLDAVAQGEAGLLARWAENIPGLSGHILFATSGSTGDGKWVALSRGALLASARMVNQHLSACPADRWLLALPEFHVGGMGILARCYLADCEVIRMEGKWNPHVYHDLACSGNATLSSLVPTQLFDLVQSGKQAPPGLRAVLIGGGRLDDAVYQQAAELGWPVMETYGMTETCSQVATAQPGGRELNILPGWQSRVTEKGRLMLKGEALLSAYVSSGHGGFRMSDPKTDGWFATGDIVELRNNALRILGRADRCVKILGELVNLAEVETTLAATARRLATPVNMPSGELIVIACADHRRGSRLVLCSDQAIDGHHLIGQYNQSCKPVERIDCYCLLENIPRSPLGKVRYDQLQAEVARQRLAQDQ
ncbi:MAG: AMP-binding protein [Akkermansiaceae bacterium]|nr:AMP-binding protein [Akkermansiaceae bacterium]